PARPETARERAARDPGQHGLHAALGTAFLRSDQRPVPHRDEEARQGHLSSRSTCLAPLAGRGRIALAIRVRGYRPFNLHQYALIERLTPTLAERASLVSTPQERGEGAQTRD